MGDVDGKIVRPAQVTSPEDLRSVLHSPAHEVWRHSLREVEDARREQAARWVQRSVDNGVLSWSTVVRPVEGRDITVHVDSTVPDDDAVDALEVGTVELVAGPAGATPSILTWAHIAEHEYDHTTSGPHPFPATSLVLPDPPQGGAELGAWRAKSHVSDVSLCDADGTVVGRVDDEDPRLLVIVADVHLHHVPGLTVITPAFTVPSEAAWRRLADADEWPYRQVAAASTRRVTEALRAWVQLVADMTVDVRYHDDLGVPPEWDDVVDRTRAYDQLPETYDHYPEDVVERLGEFADSTVWAAPGMVPVCRGCIAPADGLASTREAQPRRVPVCERCGELLDAFTPHPTGGAYPTQRGRRDMSPEMAEIRDGALW